MMYETPMAYLLFVTNIKAYMPTGTHLIYLFHPSIYILTHIAF